MSVRAHYNKFTYHERERERCGQVTGKDALLRINIFNFIFRYENFILLLVHIITFIFFVIEANLYRNEIREIVLVKISKSQYWKSSLSRFRKVWSEEGVQRIRDIYTNPYQYYKEVKYASV